jgi:hypothetical protein
LVDLILVFSATFGKIFQLYNGDQFWWWMMILYLFYIFQVLFALNQTLWKHELSRRVKSEFQYTTEDLIHHYNCGAPKAKKKVFCG